MGSYWMHWHNVKYEVGKRVEELTLATARRLPARLRMWVVVDAFAVASTQHPNRTPDELSYSEVYDAVGVR